MESRPEQMKDWEAKAKKMAAISYAFGGAAIMGMCYDMRRHHL